MPYQLYNNSGKQSGYESTVSDSTSTLSVLKTILIYGALTVIILMVILLLIHYTIYPIFYLQPGDPGIIPIPGFADNQVFWKPSGKDTVFTDLSDIATNVQTGIMNYSLSIDIAIQNPYITSNGYNVIFSRGGTLNPNPQPNSSIKGAISDYNVAIALAPNSTDLIVSVLNSDGNPENVLIPNIPVQTPFRIGMVLMSSVFEVYLNGKLVRTRKYASGAPGNYTGPFHPPTGNMARSVRVGNLLLWNRLASPSNIRYAKPPLMPPIEKDSGSGTSSCLSLNTAFSSIEDSLVTDANAAASAASAALSATAVTATSAVKALNDSLDPSVKK